MKRSNPSLDDLKKTACWPKNQHLEAQFKKEKRRTVSKEKESISRWLSQFAKEHGLELSTEHVFDEPLRKWAFDWSFNSLMIAFEYEGIFSTKSRHTTATGFTGDAEKYNRAQQLGWTVFRYTAINYMDIRIDLLNIKYEKLK